MKHYTPEQGDFIVLDFDPQAGHEQKGRRPALVLSKKIFNEKTGFAYVCPITSKKHDYPFHSEIPEGHPVHGYIMVDQARSLDYKHRKAHFLCKCPQKVFDEILALFEPIIF